MCQCAQDCGIRCMLAPSNSPVRVYAWVICWSPPPPEAISSLAARREVAQIRWRLVLPGRREKAIVADRIDLIAQGHVLVGLCAQVLGPFRVAIAPVAACHGPRAG